MFIGSPCTMGGLLAMRKIISNSSIGINNNGNTSSNIYCAMLVLVLTKVFTNSLMWRRGAAGQPPPWRKLQPGGHVQLPPWLGRVVGRSQPGLERRREDFLLWSQEGKEGGAEYHPWIQWEWLRQKGVRTQECHPVRLIFRRGQIGQIGQQPIRTMDKEYNGQIGQQTNMTMD